jgi:hypothetical protein
MFNMRLASIPSRWGIAGPLVIFIRNGVHFFYRGVTDGGSPQTVANHGLAK